MANRNLPWGIKDILGGGNKCRGVSTGNHGALGKHSQLPLETMDFKMGMEMHGTGPGQSVPVNGTLSTYSAFCHSSLLSFVH